MISDYITFSCNPRTPVIVFIKYRMELIHIFLFFSVDFLSVMLVTGKPDKPKDIKVTVTGNTTKVSWQIPLQTGFSRIYLKNSATTYVSLDLPRSVSTERRRMNRDLHAPASSIVIEGLQMCSEYVVIIMIYGDGAFSEETEQKFWITNELEPPQNVTIQVIGNIAKISWTITTTHEVNTSLVSLFDSNGTKVSIDSSNNYKYLKFPVRSYEIINLTLCSEYAVKIEYQSRGVWSGVTEQKFWMTNTTFTADINQNVALSWTTTLTELFSVYSPFNSKVIYEVQFGNIITNSKIEKYKYDEMKKDVNAINITVILVNKTDAGLYRAVQTEKNYVDGCCLLIVTSIPINAKLTLRPEHPFVGDNVTITCFSTIQRWPEGYGTSHLSYQFHGNTRGATDNNRLTIHTLTKSDKGTHIKCQATDDLGKVSNMSNTVTLDPYYGPDKVILEPPNTVINVTEDSTLGPIRCNATCYPKCKYQWKQNETRRFEDVKNIFVSNDNQTLTVFNIKRRQAATFRCRVDHYIAGQQGRRTDISVNVQYPPEIVAIWLSDKNGIARLENPTTYNFSEDVNIMTTLRINSNPDSKLLLRSSLKIYQLNHTKEATDYKSKLPSLKCEDSGKFQIQASNGIPYGDNRTVNFIISCKPRNVTTHSSKIGTKVNTRENIELQVVSFPKPTIEWLRFTGFDWTVKKERYDYKYKINSTIHIGSKNDFGEYGIRICNTLGCVEEKVTLTAEDRPEAPQNVSLEATTFKSVNLSWIAGFNGGDTQNFSVQFKTTDDDKWETKIVNDDETKTGNMIYYTLNQLRSDTSYQVMVFSANKHGRRNASLEFKTKVEPTLSSPSSSASVSPLSIGIGCGCAVLLLLIILLVFISRRKKDNNTECNVLYAEVDKEQQKSKRQKPVKEDSNEPANAEYASVVKSKSKKVHYKEDAIEKENNEYAVVDNSNKDYTENESVYANQEDGELLIHKPLEAQSSGRSTNQDGLTYIEVSFTSNQSDRRPIIGVESKTDYVDIDFTRKADPLPDDSD